MLDEEANFSKVPYLYGKHSSIYGRHKREGGCALPGEICQSDMCYCHREVTGQVGRSQQTA